MYEEIAPDGSVVQITHARAYCPRCHASTAKAFPIGTKIRCPSCGKIIIAEPLW